MSEKVTGLNFYLQPSLRYDAYFAHPYPTSLPGGTGKRWLGIGGMLWCQGAQNIDDEIEIAYFTMR